MYIYCLIHVCNWRLINDDTMHGKFRTLRFKIIVHRVMGPCNLIVGYQGFSEDILSPSDGLCR